MGADGRRSDRTSVAPKCFWEKGRGEGNSAELESPAFLLESAVPWNLVSIVSGFVCQSGDKGTSR